MVGRCGWAALITKDANTSLPYEVHLSTLSHHQGKALYNTACWIDFSNTMPIKYTLVLTLDLAHVDG